MPAYNAQATVTAAVDSVLRNTVTEFELVVIDDGSNDRTAEIVESINDPRIRLFKREHTGLVDTLNFGVSNCVSRLIARMDADDTSSPTRFKTQLKLINRSSADIVGGQVNVVSSTGNPAESRSRYQSWINDNASPKSIRSLRFVESPLVHPTVMARREVFELGYRNGDFPEDCDLWLRAFQAGYQAIKVPEIVLNWVDGPERLTRTHPRYSREAFDRCRREHLLRGPLKGVRQVDLWGAGQTGKPWLRWLQSQNITVRHLIDVDPRKFGQTIHGVTVIHPDQMPKFNRVKLIAAVGATGARELISAHAEKLGYETGKDVWFVA